MEDLELLGEISFQKAHLYNSLNNFSDRNKSAKECEEFEAGFEKNRTLEKSAMAEWKYYEQLRLKPF